MKNLFLLLLHVSLVSGTCLFAGTPPPSDLRCELLKGMELSRIVDPTPRFAWVVPVSEKGGVQTSYHIQVSRAAGGLEDEASRVWDSGQVGSSASLGIEYDGQPLEADETYEWRVRVGLEGGSLGHWSAAQRFTMASEMADAPSKHPTKTTPVAPHSVVELEPGRYLLDFEKVAFGFLELELVASAAGQLTIHFGERGSSEGVLRELPDSSSVRYYEVSADVVEGKGVYRVHPPRNLRNTKPVAIAIPGRFGTIAPFRYIEIETNGIELSNLEAKQITLHYPWDEYASFFRSSNEDLDALWELCKYSMKATSFAGVYVDGDRERIPYEADSYINMLSHYAVDSEYSIGRYTHEYLMDFETWPTEWKQHSVMMAGMDFMYTGDISSIRRVYDRLKKEKTLEERAREDGLLVGYPYEDHGKRPGRSADIVDWPPVERDGYVFKEVNTVVNAFHYLNLLQMAEMAKALGKEDDASDYEARAIGFYDTFNDLLFDEEKGLYLDGEGTEHSAFHANLFPLAFGLVPEEHSESVSDYIVSKDLACSVYAAQYLLEALYQGGREDAALRLMTMKGVRSWQNMLAVGSTITLEAWDDSFKPNQDWNHAWGAAPGNAIARFLLGVRPITPGFERMLIAPRPGSLELAEGRVPTIRGPVDVSIKQVLGASMTVKLVIPGNTEPTVSLKIPNGSKLESLKVNGEASPYVEQSGVLFLEGVASGEYLVELTFK
ncbi:alpha-L-rhamnosidase C-terminal domain-containing protein [Pelagicoccus sp. SDUM812002]|uniref:alpha-L-rhamnosidase-related protein n=1 Tax=Pelagicoccus sp. SDUM812002 TaxID=3041266 RepID=UPI00280E2366|nr:alpha-L-rhamnosidase C-terminal domain-containing protein [Pelagicoccus sp. SDUM812002]MDQ8187902.1 alpha-L-rhamnosidase C-terminal domain-containing protein [Pelagicoccus sp. SDUM812002]